MHDERILVHETEDAVYPSMLAAWWPLKEGPPDVHIQLLHDSEVRDTSIGVAKLAKCSEACTSVCMWMCI